MPSKYRDRLQSTCSGTMVATIHLQAPCLLLYPLPEWEQIERQIQELPTLKPEVARLQRLALGFADDMTMDGSGRLLLPAALREHAGLDKKVVLVGQGKKLELWGEQSWQAECASALGQVQAEPLPEEFYTVSF